MKRPLAAATITFAIGIMLAYITRSVFFIICITLSLLVILYSFRKNLGSRFFYLLVVLLFFFAGAARFQCLDSINRNEYKAFKGEWVTIRGYIASEPEIKDYKISYKVKPLTIANSAICRKGGSLVLLVVYRNDNDRFYDYGREIELEGKLELPGGTRNPGGFDYRQYLAGQGLPAMVYSRYWNIKTGDKLYGSYLQRLGLMIRSSIINTINKSLPEEHAGLLNGMLIGYTEGLSEDMKKDFSNAGISHLMAVSGANIAFIIAPLAFVFKKLRIKKRTYSFIIIGVLIVFLFVAGFEPSVLRAVIMGILILSGNILFRETDVFTSIAAAALILMFSNPYCLFNAGFQLSFSATLAIVMFYRSIKKLFSFKFLPKSVTNILAVTVSAQLGVIPVTLVNFNTFSPFSLLSNLIAVPASGLVTILGSLMAILGQLGIGFSRLIGYINYLPLTLILKTARLTSELPFASVRISTPSIVLIAAYYLALWFFFWYKPKRGIKLKLSYAAYPLAVFAVIFIICSFLPRNLEVVFFDVGEGDASFIKTAAGKTMMIDGGGGEAGKNDSGEYVLIPFLLDKGIGRIDAVASSHAHEDHINGLYTLLKEYRVDNLLLPSNCSPESFEKLISLARQRGTRVLFCSPGDSIALDSKTSVEVVFTGAGKEAEGKTLNNGSLVLKLVYGSIEVLFPGDIEKDAELKLLKSAALNTVDILKVAHHGSKGSTCEQFIAAVKPRAAVISVGPNNFGHPAPATIDRLEAAGANVFRTDLDGAIVMTTDGKSFKIERTVGE